MPLRVALVIPVYNQADYLGHTIESALGQTRPFDEVIVVDDGSTDGSADVARRFAGRVRLIAQANAGQAVALNRGWAAADADIIGYLSSDDLVDPVLVARLLPAFGDGSAPRVVYPRFRLIDPDGHMFGVHRPLSHSIGDMALRFRCDIGVGALFSKVIIDRVGGWDPALRLMPDFEFWLRAASVAEFAEVPELLASWRIHPGSQTNRPTSAERAEEPLRILERVNAQPGRYLPGLDRRAFAASAQVVVACKHLQSGRIGAGAGRYLSAALSGPARALRPDAVIRVARSAARGGINLLRGRR